MRAQKTQALQIASFLDNSITISMRARTRVNFSFKTSPRLEHGWADSASSDLGLCHQCFSGKHDAHAGLSNGYAKSGDVRRKAILGVEVSICDATLVVNAARAAGVCLVLRLRVHGRGARLGFFVP